MKKIICRICFKEIIKSRLFDSCICNECFSSFVIKDKVSKLNNYKIRVIYQYNDFFKTLLYQYKGCNDYLLKDVFLDRFKKELFIKYHSYVVLFPPSNKEDDQKRGFNHLEEIVKTLNLENHNLFYKTYNFKQSDRGFLEREKILNEIKIQDSNFLKDKKILLIDDVMTSGNTIKACINLLEKIKVKKIEIIILAEK
jgi:ComF family protein